MSRARAYFDWNASAPLRPEARATMAAAMEEVGNPSSVHAEGRRAKGIVERARAQVAALIGCDTAEVVFTSGATEGARNLLAGAQVHAAPTEHDCVRAHAGPDGDWTVGPDGVGGFGGALAAGEILAVSAANSEVGFLTECSAFAPSVDAGAMMVDAVQAVGKIDWRWRASGADAAIISAHKIGGPKGVGAQIVSPRFAAAHPHASHGGGQEQGRRAGTENVVGIAGFGAAAEAAQRDLANGEWDRVAEMRDAMESRLRDAAPDLILFGEGAKRLPNTSCFAIPGWRGETQVMQMDLAGFAISAGSACSSGKVNKASRVLLAMGFDEVTASSAVRVSLGPTTTESEATGIADAWISAYRRWKARAA